MGDQKVTAATPIAIHTDATGAALATAPADDLFTARQLYPRNGAILIEPVGGGATLAAPTLLGRIRGTSRWVDLGAIDRLTGGDLVLASGVGRALAIRDALAYCDRFWVKSATVTGTATVSFVPLETYE
jgi:hypothetical protein